jgi:ribonucleoside-triphosphate reductase
MITSIIKRDGRQAPFNLEKIGNAILQSLRASGVGDSDLALTLAVRVAEIAETRAFAQKYPAVEEIQDIVERVLIDADLADAAKRYILYRAERTRAREMNTRIMKTYEEITVRPSAQSDLKRDNANIDGDTAMGSMP